MKIEAIKHFFIIVLLFASVLSLQHSAIAVEADDASGIDSKSYYQIGLDYEEIGMDEEAIDAYEKALDAFAVNNEFNSGEFKDAYRRLHGLYVKNNKLDKLIDLLKETMQHIEELSEEELLRLYYGLGMSYMGKGLYGESIKEFEKIIQTSPDFDPNIYYFLGNNFENLPDREKAIENFNKYLELDPEGRFANEAKESIRQLTEAKE